MRNVFRSRNFFSCKSLSYLFVMSLGIATTAIAAGGGALWLSSGQDKTNARHQANEKILNVDNVNALSVKWQIDTDGPVSATPTVDGSRIYFPDFAGNLYAADRDSGNVIWQTTVSSLNDGNFPAPPANNYSRNSPVVAGDLLIIGDQGGRAALESGQVFTHGSARVWAIDKHTGQPVWSTQVDTHMAAIVTSTPSVHGDIIYVGVSSYEEAYAGFLPSAIYACCTFRGSVVALDKNTGTILWKTYMAPQHNPASGPDFSGNSVWGSSPAIDPKRNSVYIATGNNYSLPDTITQCVLDELANGGDGASCLPSDNHFDAIVALDMTTGAVKWSTTTIPTDTWNVGCLDIGLPVDPNHCPEDEGPDFDFGQAPMLYSVGSGKNKRDLLAVGQKSGIMWSLNPDNGDIVWSTQSGVGGIGGGFIWGSATDGNRVYGSDANSFAADWTFNDGTVTNSGGWAAMDAASGEVLWQTANPVPVAPAGGAVTIANGVLYACAQSSFIEAFLPPELPLNNMFALDAATGNILWSHYSGGACNAGAAVVDGTLYWGFGYPGDAGAAKGSGLISFGL